MVSRIALALLGCLSFVAAPAAAQQEQPVVFLHGLHGHPEDWAATAARLSGPLAIAPLIPRLEWPKSYPDQAEELRHTPEMSTLPDSAVLIGHSNGGVVAREWTKTHRVNSIITLGTPHRGAPLLPHFFQWAGYQGATPSLLNEVLRAFGTWTDWSWTFAYVQNALAWYSDFSVFSVFSLGATLGLDVSVPVTVDMHPNSFYLTDLNSSNNLNREASSIPGRVGIVSVAHNFYWAGPARAVAPDAADDIAVAMYGAAFGIGYWGTSILFGADPSDFHAIDQGLTLMTVSGYILAVDPTFCRFVSSADLSECVENDGVVPYTSQEYPGAPNLYINDGPSHMVERDRSDDALYAALVRYTPVLQRGLPGPASGPPPAPPSNPPSDPGGASQSGDPSSGAGFDASSDVLLPGQWLGPGDAIWSGSGVYVLAYQGDGNLVLYDNSGSPLWASNTQDTNPGVVAMQGDGNFVIYNADGVPIWATGTNDYPGAALIVQGDGNVVVYADDWTPLWATGTQR